jgi:hypothetical protein
VLGVLTVDAGEPRALNGASRSLSAHPRRTVPDPSLG